VAFEKAFFMISETVKAAAEESAAKAAGYVSWTALKAAEVRASRDQVRSKR